MLRWSPVARVSNRARGALLIGLTLVLAGCGGGGGGGGKGGKGGLRIDDVQPTSGDVSGGTTVMITGNGFDSDTTITIGGQPLTNLQLFDKKTISGTTAPSAGPGPADVVVTNAKDNVTLAGGFTYFEAVSLGSLSPSFGPIWGGTAVVVTGTGFVAGTSLTIGGNELQNLQVVNNTTIQGFTPPGAGAGTTDVAVTNVNGADVITGGFQYFSPVIIFSITPAFGPTAGGTPILIRGTGFTPGTQVKIGDNSLVNVVVVNDAEITGDTPAGDTFGSEDVTVSNSNGGFTFDDGFTYFDQLTIDSIFPTGGPVAGGIDVTITGNGYVQGTTATLGGLPLQNLVIVDAQTLTGQVPAAGAPGFADLVVVSPFDSDTMASAFEYFDSVTISGITPGSWFTKGGLPITVTGTGFFPGTDVQFGGLSMVNPVYVDKTTIVGAAPPAVAGTVDVSVVNVNGTDALLGAFTYMDHIADGYDDSKNQSVVAITPDPTYGGYWLALDPCFNQGDGTLVYYDDNATPEDRTDDQSITFTSTDGLGTPGTGRVFFEGPNDMWIVNETARCWFGFISLTYFDHNGTIFDKSDDTWAVYDDASTPLVNDEISHVDTSPAGALWITQRCNGIQYFDHGGTPTDPLDDQWVLRDTATSPGMWWDCVMSAVESGPSTLRVGYLASNLATLTMNNGPLDPSGDSWGPLIQIDNFAGTPGIPEPSLANARWYGKDWEGFGILDDAGTPDSSADDMRAWFRSSDGLLDDSIYEIAVENGGVWVSTYQGISHLDHAGSPLNKADDTWTSYRMADGLGSERVYTVVTDPLPGIWFGHELGLEFLNHNGTPSDKTDDTITAFVFELPGQPWDAAGDPVNGVWIATHNGLVHIGDNATPSDPTDDVWTYWGTADLGTNLVNAVLPHPTDTGVYLFGSTTLYLDHQGTYDDRSDDVVEVLSPPVTVQDYEDVRAKFEVSSGGIWVATEQNGVMFLDDGGTPGDDSDDQWVQFTTADRLPSNQVLDVAEDPAGGTWFATTGGAAHLDDRGSRFTKLDDVWTPFGTVDGMADPIAVTTIVDSGGQGVWIGTVQGLNFLDYGDDPQDKADDTWVLYTVSDGMVGNFTWRMKSTPDGLIWVVYESQFGGGVDALSFFNSSGTPLDKTDDFWGQFNSSDGVNLMDIDSPVMAITTGGYWVGGRDWPTSRIYHITR